MVLTDRNIFDDSSEDEIFLENLSSSVLIPQEEAEVYFNDDLRLIEVEQSGKLSFFKKLCFGAGAVPYQQCINAIALFSAPFLLDIANITPAQVSIILFTVRFVDAFGDLIVGFIVNQTHRKFGKLKLWIFLSCPAFILSYMMLWKVPNIDDNLKPIWYTVFYCIFHVCLSCLHVPYTALTMHISSNQVERDSATLYRIVFELVGVVLAGFIQGIIITIYGQSKTCDPLGTNFTIGSSSFNNTSIGNRKIADGYQISAAIQCLVYLVCILAISTVKENPIKHKGNHNRPSFFHIMKLIFKHKSYVNLLFAFLFSSLGVEIVEANFALYCKYSINAKDIYQLLIILILVSSILSLPLWHLLTIRFGKKATYQIGNIIFIISLLMAAMIESNPVTIYVVSIISGISMAAQILLPWSMLPDVIDEFVLLNGIREESLFYSLYVCFSKASLGITLAVTTALLGFAGYINCLDGCCIQPKAVGVTLKIIMSPLSIFFVLISMIFLWKYPINETRREEIKHAMERMKSLNDDDD